MNLEERLAKLKEKIEGNMPSEYVNIMHQATRELINSGMDAGILKEGDTAPEFVLNNQNGEEVSSTELLKQGPLVITFYRGVWCPYCNADLANLNRFVKVLDESNTTMISISPQTEQNNQKIVEQQRLKFDLLSDPENSVANKFGLRWEMVDPLKSLYRDKFNIVLPVFNGEDSWTLPVPARFIINQEGKIVYSEFSIDYTKRPNPDVLVDVVKKI